MDNEDKNATQPPEPQAQPESFAELLDKSSRESERLNPGQKVKGKVQKITQDWVFIDTGRKGEGTLDIKEFRDEQGNVSLKEGDALNAYFLSSDDEGMRFTTRVPRGSGGQSVLREAFEGRVPVEGAVEKEVKGGFEVRLGDKVRAFCPFSQMSTRRVNKPEEFLGKVYKFIIAEYGKKGRNIVLSRRALLEEEGRKGREALMQKLKEGMTVSGKVTSIRDFGAFVELEEGVEGLIPVSEAGWGRVGNIRQVLEEGQLVQVIVKQLERESGRITLSLKDATADPWAKVAEKYRQGTKLTGKVVRLTPFGAFVELEDGVDGLLHVSKLGANKKVKHPRDVIQEGQILEVKVDKVDKAKRRLALSLQRDEAEGGNDRDELAAYRRKMESDGRSMGTLGDILKAKLAEKEKK